MLRIYNYNLQNIIELGSGMDIKKAIIFLLITIATFIPVTLLFIAHQEQYQKTATHNETYQIHSQIDNYFISALIISHSSNNSLLFYLSLSLFAIYFGFLYLLCFANDVFYEFEKIVRSMVFSVLQIGVLYLGLVNSVNLTLKENSVSFSLTFYSLFFLYFIHYCSAAAATKLINDQQGHKIFPRLKLSVGILINIFLDYQLISRIEFSSLVEKFLSSQSTGWDLFPYIWAYLVIILPLLVIDTYVVFFIHFYNVFTHPLSYSLGVERQTAPDYIQLDSQLKTQIHVRFWVIILKIISLSWICISIFMYEAEIFFIPGCCLVFEVYGCLKMLREYYWLMKMEKYITEKAVKNKSSSFGNEFVDKTCTICFWEAHQSFITLSCGHLFHVYCLKQWVLRNNKNECLKCKKAIDSAPAIEDRKTEKYVESRAKIKKIIRQKKQNKDDLIINNNEVKHLSTRDVANSLDLSSKVVEVEQVFSKKAQLDLDFVKIGDVGVISTHRKEEKVKREVDLIGSLPYGFPKEAVYQRSKHDMKKRHHKIANQNKVIKLLEMPLAKQILMIPQL